MSTAIVHRTVLVTGANRGLGRALVDEALRRGAKRVHAASRRSIVLPDQRVTPLILDVTAQGQIQEAADAVESLDILINNAGVSVADESMRALLAGWGVGVYAAMPGPIDTDMVRDLEIPKTPAVDVARAILDGVERGEEEIFPDPMSQSLANGWRAGVAKQLERENAALVSRPSRSLRDG